MSAGSSLSSLTYDVELEDVDREQACQTPFLSFSVALEKLFHREMIEENSRSDTMNWLIGFVLFNSFLVSDFFILPESFNLSLCVHLLFYVPAYSLMFLLIKYCNRVYYNLLVGLTSCVPICTELFILCNSTGFNRLYYMSGLAAAPMIIYVLLRPRLRWAIVCVLLQCSVYLVVLACTEIVGDGGKFVTALFCISGGVVTVATAYALEGACRRSFLLSLRVRLLNRELQSMAMTDPLMGLGNRRLLDDTTALFWSQPSDNVRLASMILIDVDHFKLFNDNYGHSAGDLCLKTIGRCIAGVIRNGRDTAVRYGGEEIAIFLPDTDFVYARQVAETMRIAITNAAIPHPALGKNAVVSASFGLATTSVANCTPAELAIKADLALYAAKHHGRNQVWPPAIAAEQGGSSPWPTGSAVPLADGWDAGLRQASLA